MKLKLIFAAILILNSLIYALIYLSDTSYHPTFIGFYRSQNRYEDAPKIPYYLSVPWSEYLSTLSAASPYQKIYNEEDYCVRVAEYRKNNPIKLDSHGLPYKNASVFFSDYLPGNLVKKVIKTRGSLVLKDHHLEYDSVYDLELDEFPLNISLFITKTTEWHRHHKIATHFLCDGQRYNHIPGHFHITNKDDIVQHALDYEQYYKDRPECFRAWSFIPETFDLSITSQCKSIMATLESQTSDEVKWLSKTARGRHNAEGITVLTPEEKKVLLGTYGKGEMCGEIDEKVLVQKYIEDPLLVNNKKFDFRVYFLIASMDPIILLYHDGFLRFSIDEYNKTSTDSSSHLTNTEIAKKKIKDPKLKKQMLKDQMWTFERLETYMVNEGLVAENWLEDFVRPTMKEKMMHIFRMVSEQLLRHPGVFEMFGVDFMFDSKLNLWFLEANKSPAMQATTEEKGVLLTQLLEGMIDLEHALNFDGDFDYVLEKSSFEMIFDGRKQGKDRYAVLSEECQ